jgi:hypothetical protein
VSEEYFLPAIFKKMYPLLLTKRRKGNFCVKKNYNNIPIQVPIPAQAWFVVQLQHTRLVAWSQGWWHGPVHVPMPSGWWICHLSYSEPDLNQPTNIGDSLCILRAKRRDFYSLIVWEGS